MSNFHLSSEAGWPPSIRLAAGKLKNRVLHPHEEKKSGDRRDWGPLNETQSSEDECLRTMSPECS